MKKQPTINPNDFVSVESGSEDVYIPLNEEIEVYDVDKALDEINGTIVVGSTEDRVEYLDETKTDIREAIINKGVDVGEDDPFRSYAEKIGEIEGGEVHNQDKTITENGTYTADAGYTGLGQVVVDVPSEEPVLETLNVSANGTYTPSGNVDGYDEVVVDVPEATLGELSVTENGVYEPTSVDGYNRVEVDVNPPLQDKTITTNGTYTADSGYYGLDEVTVDIDTVNNQDKTITENGTYTADSGYTGLGTVIVDTPVVNNEDKTIRVNGTYTAGAGYTGLGEVVVDVADIPAVVEPLSVSPTTSQQIITPPANVDGFNQVTVSAVTSSIDANISAGNIKSGVSILGVQGNVVELNGETTTVSPTTSQQVITPTGQHNGLTEVTIEAVDASIDANITSANIVDGVSILGVTGSAEVLDGEQITITPTTSQQVITPSGNHNGITEATVSAVTSAIDSNIQAGNIKSGVSILGVNGNVVEANETTLNVTPTTSAQQITPTGAYTGYDEVNVSAVTSSIDANITAENIKSGVSILGVNGSVVERNATFLTITPLTVQQTTRPTSPYNAFEWVTVEAVDASIDANIVAGNIKDGVTILGVTGTYTGSGPLHYVEKDVDVNGKLINTTNLIDFTGVQEIGDYVLCGQYYTVVFPANTNIDMSSITTIDTSGCERMFGQTQGIVSVDLSGVTEIGPSGCSNMFGYSSVSSADLSALEVVSHYGCSWMFGYSDLSGIIDLGAMTTLDGNYCCNGMFSFCSGVTGAILSSLSLLNGHGVCSAMFQGTSVTTLSFPALKSTSFGSWIGSSYYYYTDQFSLMLRDVTGCTVHFPSNLQVLLSGWTDVQNGFGGTNTTVLFDLPATEPTLNGSLLTHYQRNAFGDTQSALAWNETSKGSSTYYYTSGTSMPSVGASIYSNAACTTQVDTIASIS